MRKLITVTALAALLLPSLSGCIITIEGRGGHHPDRCYDCHYAWELNRWAVDVQCAEFEITIVSGGYWYKPIGTDDSQKKFHLLGAHDAGTVLGPAIPDGF